MAARVKLVETIHVRFDRRHHDVGIRPLAVDDTAIFFEPNAHLSLRIRASGDRIDRVQTQRPGSWYQLIDGFERRVNKTIPRGLTGVVLTGNLQY